MERRALIIALSPRHHLPLEPVLPRGILGSLQVGHPLSLVVDRRPVPIVGRQFGQILGPLPLQAPCYRPEGARDLGRVDGLLVRAARDLGRQIRISLLLRAQPRRGQLDGDGFGRRLLQL